MNQQMNNKSAEKTHFILIHKTSNKIHKDSPVLYISSVLPINKLCCLVQTVPVYRL